MSHMETFYSRLCATRPLHGMLALLAVTTLLLAFGSSAHAAGFEARGIDGSAGSVSLQDLVDGNETLASRNGELVFSDFSATHIGGFHNSLERYRVYALDDGFRVKGHGLGFFGFDTSLELSYNVETTNNDLIIEAMSISFSSVSFRGSSEFDIEAFGAGDDSIGSASTESGSEGRPFGRQHSEASTLLTGPSGEISVTDIASTVTGFFSKINDTERHFFTGGSGAVVPEPSTALLLLIGLVGLARARSRRR